MSYIVDARGLDCPQPVILTQQAMKEHSRITTIVDNETSEINVTKMAEKKGFTVKSENRGNDIYLHMEGNNANKDDNLVMKESGALHEPITLVVSSEYMGKGDDALGQVLIRSFFHTIVETGPIPNAIVFFNSGVKLVAEGSPVIDDIRLLAGKGVQVLACGTCLNHFELKEKLVVGEISNMYTISELMLGPGKVVGL